MASSLMARCRLELIILCWVHGRKRKFQHFAYFSIILRCYDISRDSDDAACAVDGKTVVPTEHKLRPSVPRQQRSGENALRTSLLRALATHAHAGGVVHCCAARNTIDWMVKQRCFQDCGATTDQIDVGISSSTQQRLCCCILRKNTSGKNKASPEETR